MQIKNLHLPFTFCAIKNACGKSTDVFIFLFNYNYRHGGVFYDGLADAVFKQPFNRAEAACTEHDSVAAFFKAAFNNFRRRAAADNQRVGAGYLLLVD